MNQERIEGLLQRRQGNVKARLGVISRQPKLINAGNRDRQEGILLVRYGVAKEHAARQLQDFVNRNSGWNTFR